MKGKRMLRWLMMVLTVGFLVNSFAYSASEKRLLVAVDQEPTTMDQSLMAGTNDYVITENWAECLIYLTPNGDLKPGLATSWKMSPDGKEIEFTLRKGVKFHSGDSLTVKDVEFSFERQNTKNPIIRTRLKSMERFEAIDDYRFKIHFKTPDVTFIPNRGCVRLISKSYYDRVGEDEFGKTPVGTGPYKFVRYVPGQYVDIERFEGYWGEKPSVRETRFYFVPEETTRVSKLKTGEVDLINHCPYPMVTDIEKSPQLKVVKLATNHPTQSIIFANRNPNLPWYDRRVRLAMAYAIDCDAIIRNVLHNVPNRWAFLAPYEIGYDPNVKPYPYDPKRARELLAEAGYPKGFDLKLYWLVTGPVPMSREVAEIIASYWEAVGIRTKLIGEEYMAALSRRRAAKASGSDFVQYTTGGRAGAPDPSYYLDLFYSCDGGFSVYCSPELDSIIAETKATVNDAKRAEMIRKVIRIIQESAPTIPIFNNVVVYGMKRNIDFKPPQGQVHNLVLVKDVSVK